MPELSSAFPLERFDDAVAMLNSDHVGKIAILYNASTAEGIEDTVLRNEIGERQFRIFRKKDA